tara:strand:- start:687 stop:1979 length:1293 start_codon:yes stop_codon:yes gene_type:complete
MAKLNLSKARLRLEQLIQDQVDGISVRAKYIRRIIDKNPDVKQIMLLDEAYKDRYKSFIDSYNKASEGMTEEELKSNSNKMFEHGGRKFSFKTGKQAKEQTQNFRQINRLRNKLIPELQENYQLGHKDISILRGNISLVLQKMSAKDPRRKELLALYLIVSEIDKMDKIQGTGQENKLQLIEKLKSIAETAPDVSIDWKKDADLMKGLSGTIHLEAEHEELNQFKGRLSSWVGGVFSEVIKGNTEAFKKNFEGVDILNLQGSPTILQDIEKQFVETLDPSKKRKKPKKTSTKKTVKSKSAKVSKVSRKKLKKPRTRATAGRGAASQPLHLIGLINKELPNTVRKNMGAPGLENQTGRFAASVEVTDVVQTPKGFPSFGYTYQKNPYQVFEEGIGTPPWADGNRDPRELIDRSIREIAAKFAIGRFYTRRV